MEAFNRQQKGKAAEDAAVTFLQAQGLSLFERNYHSYFGEIDLIMKDQSMIVFVEVRSRGRRDFGNALESINQSKINKLINTGTHFLQRKKWLYQVNSRFDIITIHYEKGQAQVEWIKNAFFIDS